MLHDKEKIIKQAERYLQSNNITAAIKEYEKVVASEPNNLIMLNTIGDLYVRAGLKQEGIKHMMKVAESYNRDGFGVKAIAMYKKISKLDPSNEEVALKLGDLYLQQKHLVDARHQYTIVADAYKNKGQTTKALKILKTIADLDPNNLTLRLGLAESFEREGLFDDAHDAYLQIGQEYIKRAEYESASSVLERTLTIKPDSRPALKLLVEILAQQGSLAQAVGIISRLMGKNPNDSDLVIILGRTYLNANMLEQAEANFIRLLDLDPSRYDYLLEVGRRYLDQGDYDRTIEIVDRCADILIERRQHKKATALLKSVLKLDAHNIHALKRIGYIYYRLQENRPLIATLKVLIQVSLKLGLKQEASMAMEQLIQLEPEQEPEAKVYVGHTGELVSSDNQGFTDPLVEQFYPLHQQVNQNRVTGAQQQVNITEPAAVENQGNSGESSTEQTTELLESMVAQHPEFLLAQIKMLEDLVSAHHNYLEARVKLRKLYLDTGNKERAAFQCQELARIYDDRGEPHKAKEYRSEAFKLGMLFDSPLPTQSAPAQPVAEVAAEAETQPTVQSTAVAGSNNYQQDLSLASVESVFNNANSNQTEDVAYAEPEEVSESDSIDAMDEIEIEEKTGEISTEKSAALKITAASAPANFSTLEIDISSPPPEVLQMMNNLKSDLAAEPVTQPPQFDLAQFEAQKAVVFDPQLGTIANPEQQSLFIGQLLSEKSLDREWRRAIRYHQPISLIIMEVDCFHEFTSFYGQRAGNNMVERFNNEFTELVNRPGDEVFHFGGEFAVMLPDTPSEGAVKVAEKLQNMVRDMKIIHDKSDVDAIVTMSFGVATALPRRESVMAMLINTSLKALDKVKKAGRNCILTA